MTKYVYLFEWEYPSGSKNTRRYLAENIGEAMNMFSKYHNKDSIFLITIKNLGEVIYE